MSCKASDRHLTNMVRHSRNATHDRAKYMHSIVDKDNRAKKQARDALKLTSAIVLHPLLSRTVRSSVLETK
jgi:hypothetical protein